MENIIIQISKYVLIILFAIYTFYCFRAFAVKNKNRQNRIFHGQRTIIFLIHLLLTTLLFMNSKDTTILIMGALQMVFYLVCVKLYQLFYKGLSKLILNNMMMCMMIGFIMLERLAMDQIVKQFIMAAAAAGICLFVPLFIQKFTFWERLGWQYALVGILLLLLVFVVGREKYGAANWVEFGGIGFQPSEFVKIIYVFFIAAVLAKSRSFKEIVLITFVAGIHVVILVLEKDLGAALIFFVTYIMMLYIGTAKLSYLLAGFGAGTAAAVGAYYVFSHVRVRVLAWRDPWSVIDAEGYQIAQSLFAMGNGGWDGTGLNKGLPESIPVVESDFVFAAIVEELGAIFAVCLILIYLSSYIMFVNIALKM
ncbi:MAG: FtsW/RodA/SpoVE family cell cycle protein, partial [Lachnoclostridium sp.]|nr:FtsW/RodA/SpoVE family cell cycle protein [Lachnoclostridium sp.]